MHARARHHQLSLAGAIDGGLHVPDFTAIGLDPHTLQFQAATRTCGLGDTWQMLWWWPAGLTGP